MCSGTTLMSAGVYGFIGDVHFQQQDYNQAISYYNKATVICETIAATNPGIKPSLARIYNNIRTAHAELGQVEKQLEFYFKALEIFKHILGDDHPSTKQSYKNIMQTYKQVGDMEKANEYRKKAQLE